MAKIHVRQFLGIAPKIGATLLAEAQSQTARNARLWSQTLRPYDGLSSPTALSKTTGEIKSIFRYNNNTDWLCWTQDVNVVRTPVAGDQLEKIYFTGTDKPRVTTKDLYDDGTPGTSIPPASYILGIPAPVGPPVATDVGAGNITATSTWVYTFVRKWSDGTADEGPPSPPSNSLTLAARQASVTMPNGAITVGDYGITHKRLYRSNGGAYFFVSESTIATSPATDNLATASLGSAITTTKYLPPPDDMIGICELANGVLAGFAKNIIYLSEPYRPWAFPSANQYAVAWTPVAIGGYGTTVVVATTAYPYIGRGLDPAAYTFKPQSGAQYPCISKRSMAAGEVGVFWATNEGIALANEGGVTLATKEFLTQKEWRRDFAPDTMHGIVFGGRYYGWFTNATDINGNKIGGGIVLDRTEPAYFTQLRDYVEAAAVVPNTGEMWIAAKVIVGLTPLNYVQNFNSDPSHADPYEWKSKVFVTPGRDNFGWGQIIADYGAGLTPAQIAALQAQIAAVQAFNAAQPTTNGPINGAMIDETMINGDTTLQQAPSSDYVYAGVTFQYWANGILKLTRDVTDGEPFPMPAGFTAEKHEFQVSGAVEVTEVTLASTVEELAEV